MKIHWLTLASTIGLGLACEAPNAPTASSQPAASPSDSQRSSPRVNRDLSAQFELAPGLQATLWAESPELYNPTAIDVDSRGRIWVAEAVNYRKWGGRNPGLEFPKGDRIVILEDTNGDGVCDSSKVFVEDTDLVAPLGIAVLGDQVVVSCSPNAIVYTDANHDDVPDKKEIFLTGFGGHDHDHGLHSFVGGPDGRWWFNCGNAGPHIVTDKSGWTLRSGSIYSGGGPSEVDNKPRMKSDDGRVWTGGLILRIEPDGTKLAVEAHNFRNNYEVALDSYGNAFQADNDDDGNASCRTLWCMESANYGYFCADGSRYWFADRRPGQSTPMAHWHQDDPGVSPCGTINGAGGPTGVVVNENDALGSSLDGVIFDADAGANVVYAHRPKHQGAGFALEPGFLIRSRTGAGAPKDATYFRPSDVAIGLDGAAYVADWYDAGVGGHGMSDTKGYGRILRIAPKEKKLVAPKLDLSTIDGEIAALASPAVDVRWNAWQKLAARGANAVPALEKLASNKNPRLKARALWLLARSSGAGVEFVEHALIDYDEDLRITAFRALRAAGLDAVKYAHILANDQSAAVRREAALALRDVNFDASKELLDHLARQWDGKDRFYLEALGVGASGKESELFDSLVARREPDPNWSAKLLGLAWRLHPTKAVELFKSSAVAAGAKLEDQKRAIDGLAFVQDRSAAEAMLDIALAGPSDVRSYAAWWLAFRNTNDWSGYNLAFDQDGGDRKNAKMIWTSGVVENGVHDFDVDVSGAKHVFLVVDPGRRGNSCDWSDWLETKFVGAGGETSLSKLAWTRASAGWGSVQVGKNCNGGALAIDDAQFTDGIGTHAASEIVFAVPGPAFTHLKGKCGPDDGGTKQASHATDVEFQIWIDSPADRSEFAAKLKKLVDTDASAADREAIAIELAKDRDGALALIDLAEKDKLAESVKAKVADALLKHDDPAVRALAAPKFAPPSLGANGSASVEPSLDQLATMVGDKRRGQAVFFGKTATCSTCHAIRGKGGDVGPDLSEIRKKYGQRELLDNILHPNKAIDFGYQTWMVETTDGLIYTGFLQAGDLTAGAKGTGTVVLKDTSGKRVTFPENEVESATRSSISVMPANVAFALSKEELADLAAFLLADPNEPPKLGPKISLFNGRDFSGWTFFLEKPGTRMDEVWSIHDGVLNCKGQPIGYMRTKNDYTNYVISVEWRFVPGKPPGNSGVLLRMVGVDKVWPKSIEAQLENKNAGDFWNIDQFPMQVDMTRTEGRHTTKEFPCNEKPQGEWNKYVITVNGGDITLEVNGLVQNRAHWAEEIPGKICLQSEGSEIEFRNIELAPILN